MTVNVVDQTFNTSLEQQPAASEPLLHELQLGEQLNACVHQARRSDFSLMLAMLCDDVREQSQFILPQTTPIDGTSTDVKQVTDRVLRKHFDLPEAAPLAISNLDQIDLYNQGQLVADDQWAALHLSNALTPKPLAFRNDDKHIVNDVLTNTTLICQKKHSQKHTKQAINKPLNVQVENWLKAVQTSIVKSNLMDVVAA
ncbi:MAG: hypothetical protein JKY81_04050 [Colwellia sp.]|nr:hypothetical protein [Colwellia sp.]